MDTCKILRQDCRKYYVVVYIKIYNVIKKQHFAKVDFKIYVCNDYELCKQSELVKKFYYR